MTDEINLIFCYFKHYFTDFKTVVRYFFIAHGNLPLMIEDFQIIYRKFKGRDVLRSR